MAGVLVAVPAFGTLWLIEIILELLVAAGEPLAMALGRALRPTSISLAELIVSDGFRWVIALLLVLSLLYALGTMTTKVVGQRMLEAFDKAVARIPLVDVIYAALRQLVASFQRTPHDGSRVVLIEFPTPEMKTVGLVTRTFRAIDTGQELAAVFVPTAPNPTSGYIEIVPVERLVWLDWTTRDAMQFVMSGGAIAPDGLRYATAAEQGFRPQIAA
ncbi:MAG: DUF502 domain-containing protein [Geminicoccaceae bacterium]